MEEYSEIASKNNTSSWKKCLIFFRKHRFQVTLEPVVCFVMLSLGLNQVLTVLLLCLFPMNYYIGLNINTMHSYSIHEPFIIYCCMKVIRSSLLLEKMCRSKLNYTSEMCDTLAENPDIQDEVQRHVSDYEAVYRSICVVPK